MSVWTLQYWKTTVELALRAFGMGAGAAMAGPLVNAWHLQWDVILGMGLSSAALSVFTSLTLKTVGDKNSPLVSAEPNPASGSAPTI